MGNVPDIIHKSWHSFLYDTFQSDFSLNLLKNEILPKEKYFPAKDNIFRVFTMPINDIKVVILGQDPYPREGQAIGYAFAVNSNTSKPASLRIIEKEVGHELDRTLQPWVNQGVFLLNTALTVQADKAGSHLQFWHPFTCRVIRVISEHVKPIWLLWGKKAQEFSLYIAPENIILKASHPASEVYAHKGGFLGCNHFNLVNKLLAESNKTIINF